MMRLLSAALAVLLAVCALPAGAEGWTTYSSQTTLYGASDGVKTNIERAATAIDGIYVPYGGSFSFNDVVGPRTKACGYVNGVNGRGANVVGGGVAQAATTLYLALLDVPGITFTEVNAYGNKFVGNYVADGALALVTDYSAGTDFRFENYGDDMTIYMWVDDDNCYCTVYVGAEDSAWSDGDSYALAAESSFALSGSAGLRQNVSRAADSVSGVQLSAGDVFSFNDLVGPRTKEYGYVSAVNGRGVNVVGGGVAQVASVVWLAVKEMEGVSIIEKSTYGNNYNQSYVYSASDAILTDYSAGIDFSFEYLGTGTLAIYVYIDGDALFCDVYESGGQISW